MGKSCIMDIKTMRCYKRKAVRYNEQKEYFYAVSRRAWQSTNPQL